MSRSPKTLAAAALALAPLATAGLAAAQGLPPLPPPAYAPPPPPPLQAPTAGGEPLPPSPQGEAAHEVRFEPAEPDLSLLSLSGEVPVARLEWFYHGWWYERGYAPVYSRVCDRPCFTRFAPGEYRLALAKDGGPPVPVRESVVVSGPSTLRASYRDRSGLRAAGLAVGVVGLTGGIVMLVASAPREDVCDPGGLCHGRDSANAPLLAGGVGLILASAITATILALQHDEAHLTVEPLTLRRVGETGLPAVAGLGGDALPRGAALTLRF